MLKPLVVLVKNGTRVPSSLIDYLFVLINGAHVNSPKPI